MPAESSFNGLDLLILIVLGKTIEPKCSNCNLIDDKNFIPGPPLEVQINAILLLKPSLQLSVVTDIQAIAFTTIGGIEPLYSGAQKIIPSVSIKYFDNLFIVSSF